MPSRLPLPVLAALALLGATLASRSAAATPSFGYLDGAYELPWNAAFRTSEMNGAWTSSSEYYKTFGIDQFSAQLGIGYNGLNGQIDFHNALDLTTGSVTIGWRFSQFFGPIEIWGRLGAGPSFVIDTATHHTAFTGGLATDLEAGGDLFVLPVLAIGLKAVGSPQYSYPATFAADFGVQAEARLAF